MVSLEYQENEFFGCRYEHLDTYTARIHWRTLLESEQKALESNGEIPDSSHSLGGVRL